MNINQLIEKMRVLETDHDPDGWPAVRMSQISTLCDAVESAIPALDLLQTRLEQGATIVRHDDSWRLQDKDDVTICSGATIRKMLIELIFTDC